MKITPDNRLKKLIVVGDRVLFKRHTGWLHKKEIDGVERRFRILNDKEIVAIIAEGRPDTAAAAQAMANAGEEYDTRDFYKMI